MLLKKSAAIGAALALMSVSAVSYANLVTHNNTSLYSTVRLADGTCAASGFTGKYTSPNSTSNFKDIEVRLVCGIGKKECKATIIMSKDEASVKACAGEEIATATLDLGNPLKVTQLTANADAHYKVDGEGGNELTLSSK